MRKFFVSLFVVALVALALPAGALIARSPAPEAPGLEAAGDPTTITVSGRGVLETDPDRASLSIGVETRAETAREALDENNELMQAVREALLDAGVSPENLQTGQFNIHPERRDPEPMRRPGEEEVEEIVTFRVTNTLNVQLDDPDMVGAIIDAAVEAGANQIRGVNFYISDMTELRYEALRQATEAAWQEADVVARALGGHVSGIVSVDLEDVAIPRARAVAEAAEFMAGVPIEAGKVEVSASVRIVFAWAPGAPDDEPTTIGRGVPDDVEGVDFERVAAGNVSDYGLVTDEADPEQPTLVVVRDESAWNRLLRPRLGAEARGITADFQEYVYVAVFLGQRPTGGYSVTVDEISVEDNVVFVWASSTSPGPGDMVIQVLTSPYTVVAIPAGELDDIEDLEFVLILDGQEVVQTQPR